MTNLELIKAATTKLNPVKMNDTLRGDVACALLTDKGNLYYGVCMDIMAGIGFCAEHSAIAAMVTAGEFKINKIVAVWRKENCEQEMSCDDDVNLKCIHVLSPCGRCREFINQIHSENLEQTEVVLDIDKSLYLKELLPYSSWFKQI